MDLCYRPTYVVLMVVGGLLLTSEAVLHQNSEDLLLDALFTGYRKWSRPVENVTEVIKVDVQPSISQVISLEEYTQVLVITVWVYMKWHDFHFTWNPEDYGGVGEIHVPGSSIWKPELILFDRVDPLHNAENMFSDTNVLIDYQGNVTWYTEGLLHTSCSLDVTRYPFDKQHCPLTFGPWSYDVSKLELRPVTMWEMVGPQFHNTEWAMIGVPVEIRSVGFTSTKYAALTYTIILQRKPGFVLFNLVYPSALILLISFHVFLLPPESTEKVSLGVTLFLAMIMFQIVICQTVPVSSDAIPLLSRYFAVVLGMLTLSILLTVHVQNMATHGERGREVPYWMRKLLLHWLPYLVSMQKTTNNHRKRFKLELLNERMKINNKGSTGHSINHIDQETMQPSLLGDPFPNGSAKPNEEGQCPKTEVELARCKMDWKLVAMVTDRLLLYALVCVTVCAGALLYFTK